MFEKIIWIYWEQGWEEVPLICNLCKQSWEKLNSTTWKINVLEKKNLDNFINVNDINTNFWDISPIQARADIIRTLLLQKYGGVWVDSTTICMEPLDDWLFKQFDINDENDFFVFKVLTKDISLSNWFLVSHPNNYIINKFTEKYTTFFKTNLVSPQYFQFHLDFCFLLTTDKLFYKYYMKNKKLCASAAKLFVCSIGFDGKLNINETIKKYKSPVYKLTYRFYLDFTKDTYISELFKKIDIDIKRDENIKYDNIKYETFKTKNKTKNKNKTKTKTKIIKNKNILTENTKNKIKNTENKNILTENTKNKIKNTENKNIHTENTLTENTKNKTKIIQIKIKNTENKNTHTKNTLTENSKNKIKNIQIKIIQIKNKNKNKNKTKIIQIKNKNKTKIIQIKNKNTKNKIIQIKNTKNILT